MTGSTPQSPILEIRDLCIDAVAPGVPARRLVEDLSLTVAVGEVLGIVGESGSGKSLSAFAVARLLPDSIRVSGGSVHLGGQRIDDLDEGAMRGLRGGRIGFVFQDPLSSFNPVRSIGSILIESIRRHQGLDRKAARALAVEMLSRMRLPARSVDAYPHQLSGGQRQRAMIALALANGPDLLIADEPTTALDPTIQLQILALLKQQTADRASILITHDFSVAAAICDRIAVMHRGRLVETGLAAALLAHPQHDYTRDLLRHARLGGEAS
ncbi:ABC transporter ATP-binding protein [Niveispirillum sp.]|uniref:ATP-binding cassette domain-containing protein n=1 Tax=Niveispirillum sp. TaxID=1917217 RepID=UPI001B69EEDD|nr:ABC transporter ATP-binding protein [Niveispirillum sp.]MBP7335590.1 ABC transporter ATP-binding protein [Niveispirillum sp.]